MITHLSKPTVVEHVLLIVIFIKNIAELKELMAIVEVGSGFQRDDILVELIHV